MSARLQIGFAMLTSALWVGAADAQQGLGACIATANAAFEQRLTEALNRQAAPGFDLVQGQPVGDCAAIAVLRCGDDATCRQTALRQVDDHALAFWLPVPAPDAVAGRNPPFSDGLYATLWDRVVAGPDVNGCAETQPCRVEAAVAALSDAAALWQTARVIGVVAPIPDGDWVIYAPQSGLGVTP